MGGNPRRPHGLARLAAVGAATVAGAALLSGWDGDGTPDRTGERATGRTAAGPAGAVLAAPSPSADDVRTLKQGQTLTVAISPNDLFDIPASSADVTLTALKQADRLPQGEHLKPEVAERGMTFVCLEFKVTNVSTEKFDTSHLTEARWTGKDGEAKKVDQEIGAHCAGLGLVKENLLSAPDPRPGEFVRGTTCSRYLTVRRVSWSSPTSRTTPCSRPRRPPSVEALECPERVTGMGPIRRLRRVRLASP